MSDNRSVILASSLHLFAARGYDAVGVQEIADASGVKKPTLYHYFGSKKGILETLMKEQFTPFLDDLRKVSAYSGDLPLSLRKITEHYFSFVGHQPVLYKMHLALWFANPENEAAQIVSPLIREQHQLLEDLFLQAAGTHGNMQGRHGVYAATFLGIINSYIMMSFRVGKELNGETVANVVQQFSYGIYS